MDHIAIIGGGKIENRRELDFYPTPPETTKALMNFLNLPACTIWEPACGNGSMSEVIKQFGHKVISTDIKTDYGDTADFLTTNINADAIITNPPFNIADKFIEKAVKEAPIVAMLLKSQYWHAKKRINLFQKHKPSYILALTWRPDFLFQERINGEKGSATMDCIWTIWKSGDEITKYLPIYKF